MCHFLIISIDFKLLTALTTQLETQILPFVAITKIKLSVSFCWLITYLTFFRCRSVLLITLMITDRIGLHSVLLP